jgi:hypothetical protein
VNGAALADAQIVTIRDGVLRAETECEFAWVGIAAVGEDSAWRSRR